MRKSQQRRAAIQARTIDSLSHYWDGRADAPVVAPRRPSPYAHLISEDLAALGRAEVSPNWIEAWMRLEHSTLDGLSREQFRREVIVSLGCVDASTPEANEACASSFGFR